MPLPRLGSYSLEDQAEVVRPHLNDLAEHKSGVAGNVGYRLQVAETPVRIARAKIRIKLPTGIRSVAAVATSEAPLHPVEEHESGGNALERFLASHPDHRPN